MEFSCRYWVVLGVFSLVELMLDLLINPLPYSFPSYLIIKLAFLAWCMAPVEWNGSDVIFNNVSIRPSHSTDFFLNSTLKILFPLFQQHHKEIEDQAEMAKKTVMEKLGLCFKKEKGEKGEKVTKSLFKKMETVDKKEA